MPIEGNTTWGEERPVSLEKPKTICTPSPRKKLQRRPIFPHQKMQSKWSVCVLRHFCLGFLTLKERKCQGGHGNADLYSMEEKPGNFSLKSNVPFVLDFFDVFLEGCCWYANIAGSKPFPRTPPSQGTPAKGPCNPLFLSRWKTGRRRSRVFAVELHSLPPVGVRAYVRAWVGRTKAGCVCARFREGKRRSGGIGPGKTDDTSNTFPNCVSRRQTPAKAKSKNQRESLDFRGRKKDNSAPLKLPT